MHTSPVQPYHLIQVHECSSISTLAAVADLLLLHTRRHHHHLLLIIIIIPLLLFLLLLVTYRRPA